MKIFFFSLLLGTLSATAASSTEGVTYCIKPNSTSKCVHHHCQQCETLQYYIDRVDEIFNQQNRITMSFMPGTHLLFTNGVVRVNVSIVDMVCAEKGRSVMVIGPCKYCCALNFSRTEHLSIENLEIANISVMALYSTAKVKLSSCLFQSSQLVVRGADRMVLEDCTFREDSSAIMISHTKFTTLRRCNFLNRPFCFMNQL